MDNNFMNFRLKLIFLALCILILLAIRGHIRLGYAPELEKKSIAVAFDYYGAFEKEVEDLVSKLEEAYMELDGIKNIHSVSELGKGYILCIFSDKTSLDKAYVQLSDITANVWSDFPEGVNRPSITRSSRDTYPVYISYFPLERETDADLIKEAYEAVPGVGNVELGGRKKKELMVELHSGRLTGMALPGDTLGSRLRSSNLARKVAMPGGQTLVLSSRLSTAADFSRMQVTPGLRLSDVADIKYQETESKSLGHIDGQPMLLFFIMKSGEGNTVQLCRELEKVTSQFGGSQLFSLGNKIKKSFIVSSSILLLLFIFLLFGLWLKTNNFYLLSQNTCRSMLSLLAAIAAVTAAGFQVDMSVMAALFLVVVFSFKFNTFQRNNYSPRQFNEPITVKDIAILRSIGRKSINDFTSEEIDKAGKWAYKFWQQIGTKSPFFRRWFGDWREADTSKVEVVDIPGLKNEDLKKYIIQQRGTVENLDTKKDGSKGWDIRVSANGEKNTAAHASKAGLSAKALVAIDNLIKNAVLLDTEVNERHANSKAEVTFDHKFYALGRSGNDVGLYKITVEEIYQDYLHPDEKRFHNLRYIEKIADDASSRTSDKSPFGGTTSVTPSATDYTVADLHALVKKYDKAFHPRPYLHHRKKAFIFTAFTIILTLIIVLYAPLRFRSLALPCCIAMAAGCCASALFLCFAGEIILPRFRICVPLWCYTPILFFVLFLISNSSFFPFASDVSFSMEYEGDTSFPFIRQSALEVESALLKWNAFDRLTLHIDQGRASFTVLGGKKGDIMAKISELSALYPEIFFYIPEKHTRHAADVTVYGNDVPEIENNILRLAKYVNKSENNVNIIYNFKSDVTNIVLEIPVKCASAGFYPYDVYKTLYYTASEPVVDKYFSDDVETDVKIRGDVRYRETLSGLLAVPLRSPFGMTGEAGDYITVRRELAQGRIYHKNRMRVMSFSVTGISRSKLRKIVSDFPFTGSCHGEVGQ